MSVEAELTYKIFEMQSVSIFVIVLVSVLFIIDGIVVVYACLLQPKKETSLFIVGIITFVICFTLPFVLITGFLVSV